MKTQQKYNFRTDCPFLIGLKESAQKTKLDFDSDLSRAVLSGEV